MVTIAEAQRALEVAQDARRVEIRRLHDVEALTFAQIGVRYGFSRARAHRLYWNNQNKAHALDPAKEC